MTRLLPALLLAAAALAVTALGATRGPDFQWLYLRQLEGYRAERDRADAAEAAAQAHEIEAARLMAQVEELSLTVGPLRVENERLRERNAELAVLGQVEAARRAIGGLRASRDALAAEVGTLSAERATLAASLNVLQSAQAWIAEECPVGYECRGFPIWCTGSMRPTMDCDDLPVGHAFPASVEQGDIVIYESWKTDCGQNFYVMHRIRKATAGGYILKGDANATADPCVVPLSAIVAVIDVVFERAFPEALP